MFKSIPQARLHEFVSDSRVVLVEDYCSAVRVGRLCNSAAVLGTHLSHPMINEIRSRWSKVVVWLDGDAAGRKGSDRMAEQLQQVGMAVTNLSTDKDPKKYTNHEIREIIESNDRH